MVDPATLKVIAKMPVGDNPHEVVASTDGTRAYASNYDPAPENKIYVFDLVAHKALPPITLGPLERPHGLFYTDGNLWFTVEGSKVIGRYDPSTQKVEWIMGTGQNRTHMVNVSPDLKHIVTTNVSSATVSLIDLETMPMQGPPPGGPPPGGQPSGNRPPPPSGNRADWNETVVPVGHGSEGFDISPDRKEIWTANAQDGTISVIDYAAKKVVDTLHVDVNSANRLKFTLDGKLALVSLLGGPDLVILDASTRKVIKRIPIGHGAAGILIDPNGTRAFVACTPDNYIAIIDLKTLTVTGHIDAGGEPDGMDWASHP
jgi:DNA-binding beta-propeller fold protein YncE